MYKGLIPCDNTSELSLDLQINDIGLDNELQCTQSSSYTPELPPETESLNQLIDVKLEEHSFEAYHDQPQPVTKTQSSDNHGQSLPFVHQENLVTLPSTNIDDKHTKSVTHENVMTLECEEIENDYLSSSDENELTVTMIEDENFEISEMYDESPQNSIFPSSQISKQCEDNEEYRCPLFSKTSYVKSFPNKILKHTLPNQLKLQLHSSPLMIMKKNGGLLSNIVKYYQTLLDESSGMHLVSEDTDADYRNSKIETSEVCSTKSSISSKCLQISDNIRNPEANSFNGSEVLKANDDFCLLEFPEYTRSNGGTSATGSKSLIEPIPCTPKATDTVRKTFPKTNQKVNITSKIRSERISETDTNISQQNSKFSSSLEDSQKPVSCETRTHTKELRMFRKNVSPLSIKTVSLPLSATEMNIKSPSNITSHQLQHMTEKDIRGKKHCINLPNHHKDEINKHIHLDKKQIFHEMIMERTETKDSDADELVKEKNRKMESDVLNLQNPCDVVDPMYENSYSQNIVNVSVNQSNSNELCIAQESVKPSGSNEISVGQTSEDLNATQRETLAIINNSKSNQDSFTTKSSDHLLSSTCPTMQQTTEGYVCYSYKVTYNITLLKIVTLIFSLLLPLQYYILKETLFRQKLHEKIENNPSDAMIWRKKMDN